MAIRTLKYDVKRGKEHHQFGRHHKNYVNILGIRFGKLKVIEQKAGCGVKCLCDCGREHIESNTVYLRKGTRKSCGFCNNMANPKFNRDEDAVIINNAGILSTKEIADIVTAIGRRIASISTIKNRVARINKSRVEKISLRRKGELYPHAKGSDYDVELCRSLYDEGIMPKEISEKMGMTRSHVSAIVYYHSRTESANGFNFHI
ncbi:hypothetical protein C9I94_10855 [Photobacterium swingsii]|uniref:Uncharacterized protein n=1 Tax=Photobacterium swingsii TaxID=680026 RepID=A0A2T3P7F8_9GAMM|nr:hypothetical protein [Photobacterium swingsii]PSW24527.1 hypothetical protein C9I94_10855 [Photobacterium swingsii]